MSLAFGLSNMDPQIPELPPIPDANTGSNLDPARGLSVTARKITDLTTADLQQWSRLAARCLEPNPFQEPEWILSLTRAFQWDGCPIILTVQRQQTGEWLLAGTFLACPPTASRPLPHLRSMTSDYSFADHPLVDGDDPLSAFCALFEYLARRREWHGIRFRRMKAGSIQQRMLDLAAESLNVAHYEDPVWERPMLLLRGLGDEPLLELFSKNRRKSLRRAWRWLEEQGNVSFRLTRPDADQLPTATEDFLRVESLGWKGQLGTAMVTRTRDANFLRDVGRQLADQKRILFGELRLNDQVIASTCNLLSANVLFSFKIGWDPQFASGSPGFWSEMLLVDAIRRQMPEVEQLDSCASRDSYLAPLYRDRCPMRSAAYVWSRRADTLCFFRQQVQRLKQLWKYGPHP